ncbi:hypothetical protein PGB90_001443 [Kerria lacca]
MDTEVNCLGNNFLPRLLENTTSSVVLCAGFTPPKQPDFEFKMSGFVRMAIDRYVNLVDSISASMLASTLVEFEEIITQKLLHT